MGKHTLPDILSNKTNKSKHFSNSVHFVQVQVNLNFDSWAPEVPEFWCVINHVVDWNTDCVIIDVFYKVDCRAGSGQLLQAVLESQVVTMAH